MKTINYDKLMSIFLTILLDIALIDLFSEMTSVVYKGSFSLRNIPLLLLFLGFFPFVISLHFNKVSKYLTEKLSYIGALAACISLVLFSAENFYLKKFDNVIEGLLYLSLGISFTVTSILTFRKIVLMKTPNNSSK